ncbi:unnamed protein product [Ectocarpus sp. 4 AP-2014]
MIAIFNKGPSPGGRVHLSPDRLRSWLVQDGEEKGALHKIVVGQRSPMGRYPLAGSQVRALLEHVELEGRVLDFCGAAQDAVYTVLSSHCLRVATNNIGRRHPPGRRRKYFCRGVRR